jgi:AAA15 family ATPase/GTPase
MLVRFTVENCLSFRDRVEFSMVASEKVRGHPEHVIRTEDSNGPALLKLGILYGANASGKSNLVKAMHLASQVVLRPAEVGRRIPLSPFKLDRAYFRKATRFEFEIRVGARFYAYGFAVMPERVEEEWLVEISGDSERDVFRRTTAGINVAKLLNENEEEKQFLEFTAKGTLPNRLFLAECRERNVQNNVRSAVEIIQTMNWFDDTLVIIFPDAKFTGLLAWLVKSGEFKQELTRYLKCFDTGIQEISLTKNAPAFEMREESDGTRRLIDLVPAIARMLNHDSVVLIDELDRSLHPEIVHSYVANFLRYSGSRHSQLIVTTHDTTLLSQPFLRRDEVWFVEKDPDQSSRLASLEEYKDVERIEDLQRGYLQGRFGGVPVIQDFSWLGNDDGTEREI